MTEQTEGSKKEKLIKEKVPQTFGQIELNREVVENTLAVFSVLRQELQQMAEQISQIMSEANSGILEAFKDFPERWKLTLEKTETACDKLADAGWTLPMELAPVEVLELVDSYTKEELDEYFYNFYTQNNNEYLDPIFKDIREESNIAQWKNLVEECIQAYHNGYCLIIVPSLLSIIEGLLSKLLENPQSTDMKSLCKRIVGKKEGLNKIIWVSIWKFILQLYQYGNFGEERPFIINRHRILHGRDETNWKPVDVVRLFIAIHTLLCALPELEVE